MDNQTQNFNDEQKIVGTGQEEKGFKEKFVAWLKETWQDKLKCLYILVLGLQGLFILLQVLPMMEVTTSITQSMLGGYKMTEEKFSMIAFCAKESVFLFFFLGGLVLLGFSIKNTITYFVRKDSKRFCGFGMAKTSVILSLIWFIIIVFSAMETISGYVDKGAIFRLTFFGHLYWIVSVALIIFLFILSAKVKRIKINEKRKMEEDVLRMKIVEELKAKQENQGDVEK